MMLVIVLNLLYNGLIFALIVGYFANLCLMQKGKNDTV